MRYDGPGGSATDGAEAMRFRFLFAISLLVGLACSCHAPDSTSYPAPDGWVYRFPLHSAASIIVDAGHGGRDPGALGVGPENEKTINLAIAGQLAHDLRVRGASATMTRDHDVFIPLDDRAAEAERSHTDLFVSIHCDACPRPAVQGATVYVARNAEPASVHAAEGIVASFKRARIPCRGIRRAGYRVLVGHSRPAVLVECGYLTNKSEAGLLATSSHQQRVAAAIANGIASYFQRRG